MPTTKGTIMTDYPMAADLEAVRAALAQHSRHPERDVLILELLAEGVRLHELAALGAPSPCRERAANGTKVLCLTIERGKAPGREGAIVAFAGTAREALERFLRKREAIEGRGAFEEPLFPTSGPLALPSPAVLRWMFRRAAERAGVSRFDAHSLRRGAMTEWLAAGASLGEVAKWARRQNIDLLTRYLRDHQEETPEDPRE